MKKFSIGLLVGVLLMFSINVFAEVIFQPSQFSLFVDGQKIEQPLYIYEWTNYVPLRAVSEALGAEVKVDGTRIDISKPVTDVEAVAKVGKPSCVMIYAYRDMPDGGLYTNQGSGFVYNGYIITAKHVTEKADSIEIFLDHRLQGVEATLYYEDPVLDIAILKIYTKAQSVKLGDSDTLKAGEKLISITCPDGNKNSIDECLFSGIVKYDDGTYLTVSESSINKGSSGGAVFNMQGEVVGVAHAQSGDTTLTIPINAIKKILGK